ncbi:helix-turn-helix domain-containing protein [Nocardiopsis sp. N85]|uniref:helix-turn-helix domain-containing protein n=1 Tax=Nocardiopsis sp. N85 TaxID=3029400 RepID=UPI00237EEB48|nr:helix-turn-helix domain-containing protein [Nocardiopsis sp. N85]MDE3722585.1 helix-turn-helix domain-containing protein [Nocardiopsis sp. N85]
MAEHTTEQRLAALEARVAALEERASATTADGREAAPAAGGDPFFALNALKERVDGDGGVVFAGVIGSGDDTVEWQQALPTSRLAEEDWSRRAGALDALGHPVRLHLLRAVWNGTDTVAALAERADFGTTGQIYHHVNLLVAAGWLTTVRRGRYTVPPERLVPLLVILTAAGGLT